MTGRSTANEHGKEPTWDGSLRRAMTADAVLLFVTALGFRLMWTVLIPPWNAPDELSHFTYVAHIVEQGEIPHPPPYASDRPPYSREYSLELQKSVTDTLLVELSRVNGPDDDIDHLPVRYDYGRVRGFVANGEDRWSQAASSATGYPPLYYLLGSAPYATLYRSPILARLFGVRSMSALLGAFSCIFAYLFAHELGRSRTVARAVGLIMALAPMQCFITASVNNDAAMILAATVVCWLTARTWNAPELTWRAVAVAGAAAGLALATKPTPLALVFATAASILYRSVRLEGFTIRAYVTHQRRLLLFAGAMLGTCGPWAIYQRVTQQRSVTTEKVERAQRLSHSLGEYFQSLDWEHIDWLLIKTYWGHFGWLDLPLPPLEYSAIRVTYLAAALGLVVALIFDANLRKPLLLVSALVLLHAFFLFVGVDYFWSYADKGHRFGLQGRYFFVTQAPLSFLLVTGLAQLARCKALVLPVVCIAMFWMQLTGIATLLTRYYGVTLT